MKKETYSPQGYLTISNIGGVTIEINNTGEAVRYQWLNNKPSRWCQIRYTLSGRAYFLIKGIRYHLDKFTRL